MPARNTIRQYDTRSYYHVYNRGAGGQKIFIDSSDKYKFLSIMARYITPNNERDDTQKDYPYYEIEANAYCLMGNHFHLLVYQLEDKDALSGFMRSVSTAYSMYYNKKYKQHGHLFQSIFKASRITDESYLLHITRYIHMNPRTYMTYRWSSLGVYLNVSHKDWVNPGRVLTMDAVEYKKFLLDYEGRKAELEKLKTQVSE